MWIKKIQNKKQRTQKCKHTVGNYCCLIPTVPPEPIFECWNHTQHGASRLDCSEFSLLLLMVVAVVFLSFSFIILCSFFSPFFFPSLRKEPYWNPRWQKHAFRGSTWPTTGFTGLDFYLYCIKLLIYIYIFFLIDTKKLPKHKCQTCTGQRSAASPRREGTFWLSMAIPLYRLYLFFFFF